MGRKRTASDPGGTLATNMRYAGSVVNAVMPKRDCACYGLRLSDWRLQFALVELIDQVVKMIGGRVFRLAAT